MTNGCIPFAPPHDIACQLRMLVMHCPPGLGLDKACGCVREVLALLPQVDLDSDGRPGGLGTSKVVICLLDYGEDDGIVQGWAASKKPPISCVPFV
jgi:hypothetical protein